MVVRCNEIDRHQLIAFLTRLFGFCEVESVANGPAPSPSLLRDAIEELAVIIRSQMKS